MKLNNQRFIMKFRMFAIDQVVTVSTAISYNIRPVVCILNIHQIIAYINLGENKIEYFVENP